MSARRTFLKSLLAGLGTWGLAQAAGEGKKAILRGPKAKTVWKLQTYTGDLIAEHVIKRSIQAFNRAANGEMAIEVYLPGQIVPAGDVANALREGELDLAQADDASIGSGVDISVFSGYFPFACPYSLDIPVLFNKWGLGRIWEEAYRQIEGITWLGAGAWDPCHLFTQKPIKGLNDLDGLKVYTFPTAARFLSRLGVKSVEKPGKDVVPAIKFGELDGLAWSGITEAYTMGWYKYVDYFLTNNISGAWCGSFFANSQKWAALPEHLKELFRLTMDSSHYYRQHWYWGGEGRYRIHGKGSDKDLKLTTIPEDEWGLVRGEAFLFWDEIAKISSRTGEVIKILREYHKEMSKAGPPYYDYS